MRTIVVASFVYNRVQYSTFGGVVMFSEQCLAGIMAQCTDAIACPSGFEDESSRAGLSSSTVLCVHGVSAVPGVPGVLTVVWVVWLMCLLCLACLLGLVGLLWLLCLVCHVCLMLHASERSQRHTHQTKPSLILTAYSTVQYSTVNTVQYSTVFTISASE